MGVGGKGKRIGEEEGTKDRNLPVALAVAAAIGVVKGGGCFMGAATTLYTSNFCKN